MATLPASRRETAIRRAALRATGRGSLPLYGALAVALTVPSFTLGGATASSRILFVALAGVALLAALRADEARVRELASRRPVIAVGAFAALSAASAAWSLDARASLREALVIAGYAAVALAAGVVATKPGGVRAIAACVALVAGLTAATGLAAYALHARPFALEVYGRWHPGGPFDYPPTLALVQVFALPALLAAMTSRNRAVAMAGAAGGALACGTIALSGSRLQLVLAAAVLVAAPLVARRPRVVAATLLLTGAGAAIYCAGAVWLTPGSARIAAFGLACAATIAAWRAIYSAPPRAAARPALARAAAAGVVVVLAGSLATGLTGRFIDSGGLTHGRTGQWQRAAETALDRPLTGSGAGTYASASLAHSVGPHTHFAHMLPLEAWAELGPLGLILVLALYAATVQAVWRARRSPAALLLGAAVLTFLVTNLFDWTWHGAAPAALWAAALGAIVAAGARSSAARSASEVAA